MLGGLLVSIGLYILAENNWGQSLDLVTLIWPIISILIGFLIFFEVLFSCCAAASDGKYYTIIVHTIYTIVFILYYLLL